MQSIGDGVLVLQRQKRNCVNNYSDLLFARTEGFSDFD